MKHKLKLSFWALGILILIASQLFVLAPQKASAAALTLDTIKAEAYKYSVSMAFRQCMINNFAKTWSNGSTIPLSSVMPSLVSGYVVVGFTGNEEDGGRGNNDGMVGCHDQMQPIWRATLGISDDMAAAKAVGLTQFSQDGTNVAVPSNWDPVASYDSFAKNIKFPKWGDYISAASALQAKCSLGSIVQTGSTPTAAIVDNVGNVTDYTYGSAPDIKAFAPQGRQGGKSGGMTCTELAAITNGANGAKMLANALIDERINTAITLAVDSICNDVLKITEDRQHQSCIRLFRGYLETCIDLYYKGGNPSTNAPQTKSRTESFDVNEVAACVERKAHADGYDEITATDIAAILSDSQNQATPSSTDTREPDLCDILGEEVPMRWLACGMLTTMNGIADMLYKVIDGALYAPVSQLFGSTKYDQTIATFRIFAMAFIFIVGLIMVIAQSTGSDMVDAYTVRKVLPKLAVAIIGIAIAIPVLKIAITLTNDLGIAAGNFITTAAPTTDITTDSSNNVLANLVAVQALGTIGIFVAAISTLGSWGVALAYLGTAVLALLIAFVTIAMRQLVIVVLVLFAPLAIAASILPGTEKFWKFWRGTLLTTLLMYPIIIIFLKSGTLMASIFGSMGDDGNNWFYYLIAAVVFIAPYFMIPLAFKMAGGLVGNIFGIMNDRSKGLFDRLSKYRSGSRQKSWQGMKDGTRFRERNAGWSSVNRALQAATNLDKIDWLSPNRRGQMAAWQATERHRKAVKDMKENEFLNTFAQDDSMLHGAYQAQHGAEAVSNALAARDARRFALGPGATAEQIAANQQATSLIMRARQTMGASTFDKAIALANPYTGTGLNQQRDVVDAAGNVVGQETFTNMAQQFGVVNRAYADDAVGRQTATVMMKQGLAGSGHEAGNVSTGTFIHLADAVRRGTMSEEEANARLHRQVAIELAPGQGARGKIYAVRDNARAHGDYIQELIDAHNAGDTVETGYNEDGSVATVIQVDDRVIEYEMAKAYATLQTIGQAPGEGGDQYAALLEGRMLHNVPGHDEPISVRNYIDELMGNAHFRERVMTYANARDANEAGAGNQPPEPQQPAQPGGGPAGP